jgi:AbrB family looped-hinge helix DNA binding protein
MRASIDADGRIAIPGAIRQAAGLAPGDEVDVRLRDGIVEVAPLELPVRLEQRRFLLVAVPTVPVEPLTDDDVARVRDVLLTDRIGHE